MIDKEEILIAIEDLYKSKLTAKIDQVTTEKNDDVILKYIVDDAYENDLNEKVMNFNPFILIGISTVEAIVNGNRLGEKVTYSIVVVVEDPVNSSTTNYKRMLRYGRCLKEVAKDNWKNFHRSLELNVEGLQPISFTDMNTNKMFKAVGVNVIVTFYN